MWTSFLPTRARTQWYGEHGPTDSDRNTPQSLDQILSFFRDLDVDPTKVRSQDINFAYAAMFGLKWSDPETEHLRTEFLRKVGPDSGRHLCKYALHHHPLDRFRPTKGTRRPRAAWESCMRPAPGGREGRRHGRLLVSSRG